MKTVFAFVCALTLVACSTFQEPRSATAVLQPTTGNAVSGRVTFTQQPHGVLVAVDVQGFMPNSEHGFHIHEKGDCSSGDGMSTGGHFNPDDKPHGAHEQAQHHVGDLPSLKADANGKVQLRFISTSIGMHEGPSNIVGRGLIVHRDPDDFKTQPTGNSGPRMSCGVIVQNGG